jgi:hypothetical protein
MAEGHPDKATGPLDHLKTTGSITVSPPGPGDFSCPNAQTLFLQSVSYTNTRSHTTVDSVESSRSTFISVRGMCPSACPRTCFGQEVWLNHASCGAGTRTPIT